MDILKDGLTVALIGLAVVFAALGLFIGLIITVRFFTRVGRGLAPAAPPASAPEPILPETIHDDDEEIAAVIAAVNMLLGEEQRVVTIIPRSPAKAAWRAAARKEQMI